MERFMPGQEIVVRDVIVGHPYAVWPQRVIADDGYELRTLLRPGTKGVAPATWIRWLLGKDPRDRDGFLPALAGRHLEVGEWTWRRTTWLSFLYPDRYFGVKPMWEDGRFKEWYIDFQVPYERTPVGVDTCDLHLDLVANPDFSLRWKDEDEYAHARRLGLVPDACHKKVDEARQQILAWVEERHGPFAISWEGWAPDPAWPVPSMADSALTEPAAASLRGLPGEPAQASEASKVVR